MIRYSNLEYKNNRGSVKIHWLSLLLEITRITDVYPGLKLYFEEHEKRHIIFNFFFNDPFSII